MTAPCKGCEYRHLHCHASCEKYAAYVNERHGYQEQKRKDAQLIEYIQKCKNRRKSR